MYDAERHLATKVGTVRILYRAGTISLQAAVHPKCTLGALNMKEERRRWQAFQNCMSYGVANYGVKKLRTNCMCYGTAKCGGTSVTTVNL